MSTTVTYKGNTLTTVSNTTKTLKTAGKYMEGDVTLVDEVKLQSKTVIPTSSQQIIIPDNWISLISKTNTAKKTVNITTSGSNIQYEWSNITPKNDTKYTGIITFGNQTYGYFTFIVSDMDLFNKSRVSKRFDNYPLSGVSVIESLLISYETGLIKLFFYGAPGSAGSIEWDEAWIRLYEQNQYDGLAEVIVEPASSSSSPTIQSLSITPSESIQTFNASDIDGYKPVSVGAISSTYVGSGIDQRSSTDLTASGATVTVPAGYYAEQASKAVQNGLLRSTETYQVAPEISVDSSGLVIADVTQNGNTNPVYTSGWIGNDATQYVTVIAYNTSQLPTQAATTIMPSSSSQTAVAAGKYTTGVVTVEAVPTGQYDIDIVSPQFYDDGGVRKWRARADMEVWDGWLPSDSYYGPYMVRNAVPSNTTITPSTSSQTVGGANYVMEGPVTIAGDADLIASNIISTANIFGVQGNVVVQNYYTGSSEPSSSLGQNGDIYIQQ